MSELNQEVKSILEKVLDSGHCLASPAELEEQARAAARAFVDADVDNNGTLSHDEISGICEAMGLPVSENDDEYFDKIDTDNSDSLSQNEFLFWWLSRVSKLPGTQSQQEVMARNTFRRFDVDGTKFLDISEFAELVSVLGVNFSEDELQQAMTELDTDNDVDDNGQRRISEEEFLNWWNSRSSAVRRGGGLIAYKLKKLANKAARMFYTDIHTACWNGDVALVRMFLEGEKALANAEDVTDYGQRWMPLHYAAYNGHIAVVRELLQFKAKVDSLTDLGFTPLLFAAQNGFIDICEALMSSGADPSISGFNPELPTVHYMCPAEHMRFYPELRAIFERHSKCWFPPTAVSATSVTACSLSLNGLLSIAIELPTVEDRKELSMLPLKLWTITCQDSSGGSGEDDLWVRTVPVELVMDDDGGPDWSRYIVNYQIPRTDVDMFTRMKNSSSLCVTVAAANVLGQGPFSAAIPVDKFPTRVARAFQLVVKKLLETDDHKTGDIGNDDDDDDDDDLDFRV